VALSSRAVRRVRRVWADGKLIRGEAGDWKVATKFRFYPASEDQAIDPLIASVEGIENTPAYRGVALAVFEQLELLEFGNRIPVLTFELQADEDEPTARAILSDISGGSIVGGADHAIAGYAGSGATLGDAVAPLLDIEQVELCSSGDRLSASAGDLAITLGDHELGCGLTMAVARRMVRRTSTADLPSRLSVRYFDSLLDYQGGEQQAVWSTDSRGSRRLELPAVLTATSAKTLAHNALTRIWDGRETAQFSLPIRFAGARIGDRLVTSNLGEWRITSRTLESLVLHFECRRVAGQAVLIEAAPGRTLAPIDRVAEPSDIVLLDLPAMNELAAEPVLGVAASGGQQPWRALPVALTTEGMDSIELVVPKRAVLGWARSLLLPGSGELFDETSSVVVELRDDDWLQSCTSDELLAGANLAALGSELIQFAQVEPLGSKRYRLSRLLRARYGTEWASSSHAQGERFVLIAQSSLVLTALSRSAVGRNVVAVGNGRGDAAAPGSARILYLAEAFRPPAPCHVRYARMDGGGLQVSWVRRSRVGYDWSDYLDAPLAEESERYQATFVGSAGSITKEVQEQGCSLSSAELFKVGSSPLQLSVVQVGTLAPSRPILVIVE